MYQAALGAAMGGGGLSGGGQSDYLSYSGGAFGDVIFGARQPTSSEINVNQLLLLGFLLIVVMKVIK